MIHRRSSQAFVVVFMSALLAAAYVPAGAASPPSTSPDHQATGRSLTASNDTITFSEHPQETHVSNQYKDRGILFRGDDPYITSDGSNPTSPVLSGTPEFEGSITGVFVVPGTTRRTTVNGFSLDVGYIDDPGSTVIEYFGVDGRKLGSTPANEIGMNHVVISQRGIQKFVVRTIAYEAAGFAIDNVSFDVSLPSKWVYLARARDGVTATMTAVRDGFGARYVLTLKDTKADGKCVKAKVTLEVAGFPDRSREVQTDICGGTRTIMESGTIKAMFGTKVTGVKLQACVNRPFIRDACTDTDTATLPQLPSAGTSQQRTRASQLVFSTPLEEFLSLKDGPYTGVDSDFNWEHDGCSIPFPGYQSLPWAITKWVPKPVYQAVVKAAKENRLIGDTCLRHDFGYRNIGLSDGARLGSKPTDAMRQRVDEQWLADLRAKCKGPGDMCDLPNGGAKILYELLRYGGGPSFFGDT